MTISSEKKYICVHAHFYQPPRENPWIEEIEREESAAPYHDWNQRINLECYRANTAARLVDNQNRILDLLNNYRYLSFNFGPTLMHWLELHDPWVYQTILDADRQSLGALGGHGNAIAQVYNHIIMPLANKRDKLTQIRWGIRDFEHRFGRRPEGMWLAETAVDRETLLLLAEADIKYTILSPHQAARWRFLKGDDTQWKDAAGGKIPNGRAYRYSCGGGKYIHIFFYDPALAHGVAFERLLEHSSKLLGQLDRTWSLRDSSSGEPWLANVATDGESYGHHFKFGDMALAAAFEELRRNPSAEIVNYGWFLSNFPVVAEAEIFERTAWSCAHGLGRWSADCGCNVGGSPGWTQKWRAPMRKALEYVRDSLSVHFETGMSTLCEDPWGARDEYIDAVLDRKDHLGRFLEKNLKGGPRSPDVARFLELLEMERFTLLMFTSCGWFFDEISQLESLLILKYAAMAIQLAEKTGSPAIMPEFLRLLGMAPSNLPEYGNGANVFLKEVRPKAFRRERVAANYAIQSLARSPQREFRIYAYSILPQREEDLGSSPVRCLYGLVSVTDDRTLDKQDFLYAVVHFGGLDFRCSVKPWLNQGEYESTLAALQDSIEEQNTIKMVRVLDEKFGTGYFGLEDVLKDLRASIALDVSRKTLGAYTDLQRNMFSTYKPLLLSLRQWGIKIPSDLRVSIRRVLSDEVESLVVDIINHELERSSADASWDATDFFFRVQMARLNSLQEEAKSWGVTLQLVDISEKLGQFLVRLLSKLLRTFDERDAGRFFRLLTICRAMAVWPETWKLQTLFFQFVTKGIENPNLPAKIDRFENLVDQLDSMLNCWFARLLRQSSTTPTRQVQQP
ncbi:Glycoside hydrolase, family 57 [Syntrophobacter sp. SbD1]|nr:Glycoside hydrolase, family 57 [Syntrophobacter sp. SbD1]